MKPMSSFIVLFGFSLICPAIAADPYDTELAPLIEKAKATDESKRRAAVVELLGIRESVSEALISVVARANKGELSAGAKASALFLMGRLGLIQCKAVLEREKGWKWRDNLTDEMAFKFHMAEERRMEYLLDDAARSAIHFAQFGENVTLASKRLKTPLAPYPALAKAIGGLEAGERDARRLAEDGILRYQEVICRSMRRLLEPQMSGVYTTPVKVTAAYVLGEYRCIDGQMLLWNIDLHDIAGVCSKYPKTLDVKGGDIAYPCEEALVKLGLRADILSCIGRIQRKQELSQETRDRIARVLVKISSSKARGIYDATTAAIEKGEAWTGPPEQKESRLQRLRTVEPIIKGNP